MEGYSNQNWLPFTIKRALPDLLVRPSPIHPTPNTVRSNKVAANDGDDDYDDDNTISSSGTVVEHFFGGPKIVSQYRASSLQNRVAISGTT